MDPKLFKQAMGRFASGVTVITVRDTAGNDHGMTASAFCSVSLDPALMLVCIKNENRTLELLQTQSSPHHHRFGVNLLSREQESLSNRFAGGYIDENGRWQSWPADKDKFADLDFTRGTVSTAALLGGSLATLDCTVENIYAGGDHQIVTGRIHNIHIGEAEKSLLYFSGRYGDFQ